MMNTTRDEVMFFQALVSFKGTQEEKARLIEESINLAEEGFGLTKDRAMELASMAQEEYAVEAYNSPKRAEQILKPHGDRGAEIGVLLRSIA